MREHYVSARAVVEAMKNGSTLPAEAQKRGMEPEELLEELRNRVYPSTLRQVFSMNKRNEKLKGRRGETQATSGERIDISKLLAISDKNEGTPEAHNSSESKPEMETEWRREQEEIEKLLRQFKAVAIELQSCRIRWDENFEWRRQIQEKLSDKYKVTVELLEAFELEEQAMRMHAVKRKEYHGLKNEIESRKSKMLFLVAPGYKGEFPRFGKLISCRRFYDRPYVRVEKIGELLEEVTESEVKGMGYDNHNHVKAILDFAKLVVHHIAYSEKDIKVYILCDDSRVYRVLETQGLYF